MLVRGADRRGLARRAARRLALALSLTVLGAGAAAAQGEEIYAAQCVPCHQADGRGRPGVYPPLADHVGRFVRVDDGRAYLVRVLTHGLFGPIRVEDRPYNGLMPPFPQFGDRDIADVVNHVLTALSQDELPPDFEPLTAEEVAGYREPRASPSGMRAEREALLAELDRRAAAPGAVPRITGVAEDYSRQCQGCHRADGMGAPGAVPRFRGFVGHFTHLPEGRDYLARLPGVVYAPIDDARLAAVLNWTLRTFSPDELAPDFRPFTAEEIGRYRRQPLDDPRATRRRLIAELSAAGVLEGDDDGLGRRPN